MPDAPHPAIQRVRDAAARAGVDIEVVTFDASTHTAEDAARAIGVRLGQIVKSLVFVSPSEDGPRAGRDDEAVGAPATDAGGRDALEAVVALVSGTDRVDVRRLAEQVGRPRLRRASADEAQRVTGFAIGGIPPFGHRSRHVVVMDAGLFDHAEVWAAAGTPTAVFRIEPETLRRAAEALVASCAQAPAAAPARPDG